MFKLLIVCMALAYALTYRNTDHVENNYRSTKWETKTVTDKMTGNVSYYKEIITGGATICIYTGNSVAIDSPSSSCSIWGCDIRVKVDGELRTIKGKSDFMSNTIFIINPDDSTWIATAKREIVVEIPILDNSYGSVFHTSRIVTFDMTNEPM